jgi:hypothetical protein
MNQPETRHAPRSQGVRRLRTGEGVDAVIAFIRKQGLLDQIPRAPTVSD